MGGSKFKSQWGQKFTNKKKRIAPPFSKIALLIKVSGSVLA